LSHLRVEAEIWDSVYGAQIDGAALACHQA